MKLKEYTKEELAEILRKHKAWINDEEGGEIANLSYSDLSDSDLRGSDLRGSDFRGSNLRDSDLRDSDLRDSDFRGSNLRGSNLSIHQVGNYACYIMPDKTRIGCQYHENKTWLKFTDEEVFKMANDAKEWWTENKKVIKFLISESMK